MKLAKAAFARTSGTLGLVALAVIASPYAAADDAAWYAGASLGQSKANIDNAGISRGLLGGGFTTTAINADDRDTGYKLFGGYQFNKNFALEAGYFDLGSFGFAATTVPAGTLNGNIKLKGLNLDAVGMLPLTERWSAMGRVGVNYAEASDSFTGTGAVNVLNPNPGKREANYKVGLGVQYAVTDSLSIRGEAERYRINDAAGSRGDIDLVSLGLVYRFGGKTPVSSPKAATQPAPTLKAATPPRPASFVAAAPVLVIVPVAAKTEQYCSILDIQFEINQDDIQHEEMEKLAVVGNFMKKYPVTTAVIEGHADNVGTAERNMELSQRRAEHVVSYLVESIHINPSRLQAVGYGETRPIADNSTEEGKRMNRRIDAVIACATDVEGLAVAHARTTMALVIDFDQNKADIGPQYHDELRKVANFLKANPTVTATVEGHTGNLQATPELAMDMSQRRAQNVVNYLADNFGIARTRLAAEGFGQTRRVAYNTSLEGQQENRRVNIIFKYAK